MKIDGINVRFYLLAMSFFSIYANTLLFQGIEYPLYGYVFFILYSLVFFFIRGKVRGSQLVFFIGIFLLFSAYVFTNPASLADQFHYFAMLIPLFVFPWFFDSRLLCHVIYKASLFAVVIFLILFAFGIGVDRSYGSPRLQGLMSEPSALSFPVTVVVFYAIISKKYVVLSIGLISIYLSASVMAMIIPVFSFFVMVLMSLKSKIAKFVFLSLFPLVFYGVISLIKTLDVEILIFRRLQQGFLSLLSFGQEGYNPRVDHLVSLFDRLVSNDALLLGMGPNSASAIRYDDFIRSFSFPFEILISFGFLGLTCFLFVILFVMFNSNDKKFNATYSSAMVYVFLNSAMGITLQVLFLILTISFFVKGKQKKECHENSPIVRGFFHSHHSLGQRPVFRRP